jgi:hypothetical protein
MAAAQTKAAWLADVHPTDSRRNPKQPCLLHGATAPELPLLRACGGSCCSRASCSSWRRRRVAFWIDRGCVALLRQLHVWLGTDAADVNPCIDCIKVDSLLTSTIVVANHLNSQQQMRGEGGGGQACL